VVNFSLKLDAERRKYKLSVIFQSSLWILNQDTAEGLRKNTFSCLGEDFGYSEEHVSILTRGEVHPEKPDSTKRDTARGKSLANSIARKYIGKYLSLWEGRISLM
jgi:hypothetical protein